MVATCRMSNHLLIKTLCPISFILKGKYYWLLSHPISLSCWISRHSLYINDEYTWDL